jgi:polyhydroxyalkanoate synthesis repressor PhaR
MAERVQLKKYANRRLYDMERSVYVTLEDIAAMIRNGREVTVKDAKTDEDVTAFILTQIVLEEAKKKNILLPVPLLHMMIRHGDRLLGEFFEKHLAQTLQNFLTYKSLADEQFQKWLQVGANLSAKTARSMPETNPFQSFFDLFGGPQAAKDEPPPDKKTDKSGKSKKKKS